LLCPTTFPALSRSDKARENCNLFISTSDVVVTSSGDTVWAGGVTKPNVVKLGDAGRIEFANLRHTGHSNSPRSGSTI
jgi:hypothetical protein